MSAPDTTPATVADLLTEQFRRWELRGRGWLVTDAPVELEPPFRAFEGHVLPRDFFPDDGIQETRLSRFKSRVLHFLGRPPDIPAESAKEAGSEEPEPQYIDLESRGDLIELQVQLPKTYEPSRGVMEQCLASLNYCRSALAFEVIGSKEGIVAQVAAALPDAEQAFPQIKAHFPEAVLNPTQNSLGEAWGVNQRSKTEIREFGLCHEFMMPLLSAGELAIDPLVGVCGALEMLKEGETGLLQILFQPVRHTWAESILSAVTSEDGDDFFSDYPELRRQTKRKLGHALYAVVVRVAARANDDDDTWAIIKRLTGAMRPFANPEGNELLLLENEDYPDDAHEFDLLNRCSRRYGMLLNSDELVSLAHLPTAAVRSRKLKRLVKRTKEPPQIATGDGVKIGENEHEGKVTSIVLKPDHRVRHMHVIGASGTGKSTLLLNLICQDIYQGNGVAVLDPHGDLVDKVLSYVPPERYRDVILFDPSDEVYPVGFNILSAHSNLEKNLLSSDLVGVFQRLSTSWGDQMTSVLGNAILAFLESSKGGTLADLRRFLAEAPFRKEFLGTVTDSEVLYYWQHEFPLLKSTNSVAPLLTRLNSFLRPKAVRYVVAQRENRLDFGSIMDEGKILLCPLPQGLIGEENAHLLGALLVAKIHQLAISRQEQQAGSRKPFFLYLDEFQHFATPTMATILSGVRKYNLGLVLAHHELRQIQRSDDLASAVMSHPYTRICFRVGDEDARKLASGFSYFEAGDLQNLGTGEAIARIERADFDFNLKTVMPPEVESEDASERKEYLRYLTRRQYGRPREEVEQELAGSRAEPPPERVDPFAKRTTKPKEKAAEKVQPEPPAADSPAPTQTTPSPQTSVGILREPLAPAAPKLKPMPTPEAPALMGRGGSQHQAIQQRIKATAEGLGFRSTIEKSVLDGAGSVDLVLERAQHVFACEISVTTTVDQEVGNVAKCVRAGYQRVVVISPSEERVRKIESAVRNSLGPEIAERVSFHLPDDFIRYLQSLVSETSPPPSEERQSRGYKVKSNKVRLSPEEARARDEAAVKALAEMMRRKRKKKQ